MKRVLLLSDLWGEEKSYWIAYYLEVLSKRYDVKYYDSCKLGEIDIEDYAENNIHAQFKEFGIGKAVENLLKEESKVEKIIGFSIGGVIGWKAIKAGLKSKEFIGISSTRLRFETERIESRIQLIYGEEDLYKPTNNWALKMGVSLEIIENENHEMYMNKEIASQMMNSVLEE